MEAVSNVRIFWLVFQSNYGFICLIFAMEQHEQNELFEETAYFLLVPTSASRAQRSPSRLGRISRCAD